MSGSPSPNPKRTALVLAGSRGGIDPVAMACGKSAKAFAEVGGQPMIERVLTTIRSAGTFDAVRVCLPESLPLATEAPQLDEWIRAGEVRRDNPAASPSESVFEVLETIDDGETLVVTTADHPLLTAESVTAFLQRFEASDAAAAAALTSTDAIRKRYPEMKRTALRFRDGDVSGGNLFAFAGAAGLPLVNFWRRLEEHRKHPLRLAGLLGLDILVRYPFRQLSLSRAIRKLEQKTGVKVEAIHLEDPHMGIDVDTPEQLEQVRAIVQAKSSPKRAITPNP